MIKKTVSLFLALFLMFSTLPIWVFAQEGSRDPCQDHDWSNTNGLCMLCGATASRDGLLTEKAFSAGTGSQDDPFLIATAEELYYFANSVKNGTSYYDYPTNTVTYIALDADIDLSDCIFPSIGSYTWSQMNAFSGCFDGRGHTVSGLLNREYGFFAAVNGSSSHLEDDSGKIMNLTVCGDIHPEPVYNDDYEDYISVMDAGGIVARGQNAKLINCTFQGNLYVEECSYDFFGGIAGEIEMGFVVGCTSNTKISVFGDPRGVGGVLGGAEYNPPLVDGCANLGDVTVIGNGWGKVSGIAGRAGMIINSYNAGTIKVGGACEANVSAILADTVINCYNTGTVGTTSDYIGSYGTIIAVSGTVIQNCYNIGTIEFSVGEDYRVNDVENGSDFTIVAFGGGNVESMENCYTVPLSVPSRYYYDESYQEIFSFEEGVKPLAEMSEAAFAQVLTSFAVDIGTVSYQGYSDDTYERSLLTWKRGEVTPIFGQEEAPADGVTVEVFVETTDHAIDFDGQAQMEGLTNVFGIGETVTVTAIYEGAEYRFIGWYANGDFTKVLSNAKTYSCTVTEKMVQEKTLRLTALYESVVPVDITVNAPIFSINGSQYTSQNKQAYLPGNLLTVTALETEDFAYWVDANGKILSRDPEYVFTVVSKTVITAVYNTKVENKKIIVFESAYDQVIKRIQLTKAELDTLTFPKVPVKTGYAIGEWNLTLETIKEEFDKDGEVITVRPIYPERFDTVTVTVVGGTLENGATESSLPLNSAVILYADAATIGYRFAYWINDRGDILGYNESYAFYLSEDVTVTAVFLAEETAVEKLGTAEIIGIRKDLDHQKLSVIAMLGIPEDCTMDFAGVIASTNAEHASNLTASNAPIIRGEASDNASFRYTWTVGNRSEVTIWVRAYLIYRDALGVSHTVYGDVIEVNYEN